MDTFSLEAFAQNGETTLTELILPASGPRSLGIKADADAPVVGGITIHAL